MKVSVLSRQIVQVTVITDIDTAGPPYDPTSDLVQMAFKPRFVNPDPDDWQAAQWTIEGYPSQPIYKAGCLVGPGGTIALPVGVYAVWAKVTDNPEIPVQVCAELLTVF